MGADSWDVCPHCVRDLEAHIKMQRDMLIAERDAQYGKIPVPDFVVLNEETENKIRDLGHGVFESSWREDYEHGFYTNPDTGETFLAFLFSGKCTKCGTAMTLRYKVPFPNQGVEMYVGAPSNKKSHWGDDSYSIIATKEA